jgi:hypothetical protein
VGLNFIDMNAKIINHYESKTTYRVYEISIDGKKYTYDEFEQNGTGENTVDYTVTDEDGVFIRDEKILKIIFDLVDNIY